MQSPLHPHSSPWLHQLNESRGANPLSHHTRADVVIVGGGIAGVATAYWILTTTSRSVMLLEGYKVAHGATGHNAGQLVSYFERPFSELVEAYGLGPAAKAQEAVNSAWDILDTMYRDAHLTTPRSDFIGYAGCLSMSRLIAHLAHLAIRHELGMHHEKALIAHDTPGLSEIPPDHHDLYRLVPREDILRVLETNDSRYFAAFPSRKGCMNSALFTEEVTRYLLQQFPSRFSLFEHTPVERITLRKEDAILHTPSAEVQAQRVILATNGFTHLSLVNEAGPDINAQFHYFVRSSVGYMAAFLEPPTKSPTAISYLPSEIYEGDPYDAPPYFYLTRRPYEFEKGVPQNLVSVGGPELLLQDPATYSRELAFEESARLAIDAFLRTTFNDFPPSSFRYAFLWHGLLAYTRTGLRLVGVESKNPVLLYNLGCNGVGILPSLYGAKRIALIIRGDVLESTLFDPPA